jgi:hypothetical protein
VRSVAHDRVRLDRLRGPVGDSAGQQTHRPQQCAGKAKPAQVSQNRVIVTMKRSGDAWLVDNLLPF